MVIRENAVEVTIGRERTIVGDEIEHGDTNKKKAGIDGKYRG